MVAWCSSGKESAGNTSGSAGVGDELATGCYCWTMVVALNLDNDSK